MLRLSDMDDDHKLPLEEQTQSSDSKCSFEKTEELEFSLHNYLQGHHLELTCDGKFVRWMRGNPKHPRNWPRLRKTYDTVVICLLDLFM